MLLTLSTRSLASMIEADGEGSLTMFDVPEFAITHLQLRGLSVPASMLAGWSLEDIDRLRDRADKAGCPCLVLFDDTPLAFASDDEQQRRAAAERVRRLALAANRLGCNAVGLRCAAADDQDQFDLAASELKAVLPEVERLELNMLIAPSPGLTETPDRLTDLIKRIGGFRIGSLPSFEHAAGSGDVVEALRKLAPYAGAVHATVHGFTKAGAHKPYDLAQCVTAIRSVGFVNTLAIDYLGDRDPIEVVDKARVALEQALEAEDG